LKANALSTQHCINPKESPYRLSANAINGLPSEDSPQILPFINPPSRERNDSDTCTNEEACQKDKTTDGDVRRLEISTAPDETLEFATDTPIKLLSMAMNETIEDQGIVDEVHLQSNKIVSSSKNKGDVSSLTLASIIRTQDSPKPMKEMGENHQIDHITHVSPSVLTS
jgi:hypothetical protein